MSDPWQRPPIATSPLSVVLPAFNAAADLEAILTAWVKELDRLSRPYEILLVDDASTDETAVRAEALVGQMPALRVLRHAVRRGLGAALRTGIEAASHPLLFYTICDRQYRPEDLKVLLAAIDRVDLVTGCRAGRPTPGWAHALGTTYRLFVRVLFGLQLEPSRCWLGASGWLRRRVARWIFGVRVDDPECAFRLFRRSILQRFPIQTDGDFAQVEILAKANFVGCLIDQVPVAHQPRPDGRPLAPDGLSDRPGRDAYRLFRAATFNPPEAQPAVPAVKA
ncbi:MAG TPA: glycosyltransferase family 2 protein [Gemmataceae bacterium]|nr:glycosyltransferase family 2 protein [Gemmataceae bacterium]